MVNVWPLLLVMVWPVLVNSFVSQAARVGMALSYNTYTRLGVLMVKLNEKFAFWLSALAV